MPAFNIDSWPWKVAIVVALVLVREIVRFCSPKESGNVSNENSKWIIETLDSGAIAIGLVLFVIQPFLLQAFYIPSGSMEDTLQGPPRGQSNGGDRLLVSKLIYRLRDPQFQDVVVFKAPPSAGALPPNDDFIKRCIGTPGDIVYAENRRYFRKAKGTSEFVELKEPYVKWGPDDGAGTYGYDMKIVDGIIYSREHRPSYSEPDPWSIDRIPVSSQDKERIERAKPEAVPEGCYLMLGDHRSHSHDSHAWGFVPRANIIGKAVCIFWPVPRIGLLDHISFQNKSTAPPAAPEMLPAN